MTQPPNPAEVPPPGSYPPPPGGYIPAPGNYPPPPGAYPPPPQGAYPPPPPGAYPPPPPGWGPPPGNYPQPGPYPPPPGGYPPPPIDGGYAPPPPGSARPLVSVSEGLSWAWNKFAKNAIPLLVGTFVLMAVPLALALISEWVLGRISPETITAYESGDDIVEMTSRTLSGAGLAVMILGWLAMTFVGAAIAAAYFAGLLDIANGQPVTIASFFRPRNVIAVVVATLLVGLLMLVVNVISIFLLGLFASVSPVLGLLASMVFLLPGLILGLFALFATVAIVDRNLSPIDGIKESFRVTKAHFGSVLLIWLVGAAILFVGLLTCGVGLLVAIPIVYLLLVFTYRKLSGGTVAPATV